MISKTVPIPSTNPRLLLARPGLPTTTDSKRTPRRGAGWRGDGPPLVAVF